MKTITCTFYPNKTSTHGEPITGTWEWWLQNCFASHEHRGSPDLRHADKDTLDAAKDGPAIVLGVIRKGKSHRASEVRALHALALDIDGRTDAELDRAMVALDGYKFAAYTTYKHGADIAKGLARLRVIVPLETPITKPEGSTESLGAIYTQIWHRFNAFCGGINDPSTKDLARLHFLPATFDLSLAFVHHGEGRYLSVDDLPLLDPVLTTPRGQAASAKGLDLSEDDLLRRVRYRMQCIQPLAVGEELARICKAVLIGDSIADPGERHGAFQKLTWWLSEKNRNLTEGVLENLFAETVDVMRGEDPAWNGMPDILRLYFDAVAKRNTTAGARGTSPYTQQELEAIANVQGCTVDELKHRWIVMTPDESFFFLKSDGYYSVPARGPTSGRNRAVQFLKRSPVVLDEPTPKGIRRKSIAELVEQYGFCVDRVMVNLTIPGTKLDYDESVLHEATCPIRKLTPTYHDEIAKWLALLGGDKHEHLLDWLAVFADLEKQTPGLYIKGKKSAGKGLLCAGLARVWTDGTHTPLAKMFSNFNEELARCPLIVADEQVTQRKDDPTASIRHLVGTLRHNLDRKYRSSTSVYGAVRLILAANNSDLLRAIETTREDHDAIVTRFLVLDARQEAADYLASLGGQSYLDRHWVRANRIAEHVLHLAMTRVVPEKGRRFGIEIEESAAHREVFASKWTQKVSEWLVGYCMSPMQVDSHPQFKTLIRAGNGEFLVNAAAIRDLWEAYLPKTKQEPSLQSIGKALAVLSPSGRVQRIMPNGDRHWFYVIDIKHLLEFANSHSIGSEQAILRVFNRTPPTLAVPKASNGS